MCTKDYRDKGEKTGASRQHGRWKLSSIRVVLGALSLCLGSAVPMALHGLARSAVILTQERITYSKSKYRLDRMCQGELQ